MNEKVIRTLEFDKVRELLRERAQSEIGKELAGRSEVWDMEAK